MCCKCSSEFCFGSLIQRIGVSHIRVILSKRNERSKNSTTVAKKLKPRTPTYEENCAPSESQVHIGGLTYPPDTYHGCCHLGLLQFYVGHTKVISPIVKKDRDRDDLGLCVSQDFWNSLTRKNIVSTVLEN